MILTKFFQGSRGPRSQIQGRYRETTQEEQLEGGGGFLHFFQIKGTATRKSQQEGSRRSREADNGGLRAPRSRRGTPRPRQQLPPLVSRESSHVARLVAGAGARSDGASPLRVTAEKSLSSPPGMGPLLGRNGSGRTGLSFEFPVTRMRQSTE